MKFLLACRGLLILKLLPKEDRAEVRAVDRHVAEGTSLVFRCLVVKRRHPRYGGIDCQRVAVQAQQVDLAVIQQPGVGRAVRHVTGDAALDLDGLVLVNEGARLVRVAVEADHVLGGTGPLQPRSLCTETTVRVVAVGALHEAFLHAVVEGPRKLRAHILMTGEA